MPGRTLSLSVPPLRARTIALEALERQGWRLLEESEGRLVLERGKLGLTTVAGGLSGRSFYLTSRIELEASPQGCELRYRWGGIEGQVLGGRLGARRAEAMHRAALASLVDRFRRSGFLRDERDTSGME